MQLHRLVTDGLLDAVQQLLLDPTAAKELNTQDSDGWSPLHCSCHLGNLDLCKLLLNQDKIDVFLKNKDGNTALHYVVRHAGSRDTVQMLLSKGADPNAFNSRSETPLHYACMRGHLEIISYLLENSADANAINCDGDNSLHYAIFTRNLEAIRLLLQYGADAEVSSKRQGTPLEIAVRSNLFEIAVELKKSIKKKRQSKRIAKKDSFLAESTTTVELFE